MNITIRGIFFWGKKEAQSIGSISVYCLCIQEAMLLKFRGSDGLMEDRLDIVAAFNLI